MRAFLGFVRKETLHLLRDRQTLAILILFPVVQVLIFGFAVRTDVRDIAIAIVDPTPDVATIELRERISASDRFHIASVATTTQELDLQLRRGVVRQALVLPTDVERRIGRGDSLPLQLLTDGSDPNTAGIMMGYATAIVRRWYQDAAPNAGGLRIDAAARMRYNPTLESAHLFVPGLVAFVLTLVSALMTAISISREKETGTMEMLLVSPIRPQAIVAGKVMPYVVLGFVSVLLVLAAARAVFGVPLRGSVALLLLECGLYIVTALALGIVISTRAPNQRTAMLAALAGLMMPTLLLSGFIFPLDSLPRPLQWLSNLVPARWFLTIVRGIMIKGAGLATLWQETLILIGMTLFLLIQGSRRLAIRLG
ncbi:MAG TPA: ABC transporter permease [Gemmatimonadales bacterium]|jgi:ABC-2 type transport system permease protein|nr:ABC transporter permease [Gemmatimonadales bacterium]